MATVHMISPAMVSYILELVPEARKARRQHGADDPKVIASTELTRVFKELHAEGVKIPQIAKASGLTYHSVSARIKK